MLNPVKQSKLSDQVFEQLRDHIINGLYRADEHLPPERVLCEKFGVNRSSVREALKRLEQVGLIEIRQGSGCLVQDFRRNAEFHVLRDMIVPVGKLNINAARDMLEFRYVFFTSISKLAAARINPRQLAELESIVDRIEKCPPDDAGELQKLDLAFHSAVVAASGNLAFTLLFNSYRSMYFMVYDQVTSVFKRVVDRRIVYRYISDAMVNRDPELCEKLYQTLIEEGNQAFMENFSEVE